MRETKLYVVEADEHYNRIGMKLYRDDQINEKGMPIPDAVESHFIVAENDRYVFCTVLPGEKIPHVAFNKALLQ